MATPGPIPSPAGAHKGIDESLRQSMVQKLDEVIAHTKISNNRTGADVELTIFNKAGNVEAYKNLMQKCFYVINNNRRQQQPGQQPGQVPQQPPLVNQQQQQSQQQQLVNQQSQQPLQQAQLLHQGGFVQPQDQQQQQQQQQGNQQIMTQQQQMQQQPQQVILDQASSLLQQQQQQQQQQQAQQPQQQQHQSGKMMPQHPVPQQQLPAGQQPQQQMRMQVSQHQQMMMNQQMQQQGPMIMRPGMNQGQGVSQLQQRLTANRMQGGQMMMRPGMPMNMMGGGNPRMGPMAMGGGGGGPPNMGPMMGGARGPPPMYMNPSPHSMNPGGSPANMGMMGHSPMNQNQYMHSPAQQNQGMGSPASGPRGMVPSPMSTVNTPQNPSDPQSAAAQETQEYLEKVRQLGKYIEPLREMIARMGDEDQTQLAKMTRLMDIMSNPSKRVAMKTLLLCETALINIFEKGSMSQQSSSSDSSSANPFFEAVVGLRAKGQMNHVLQKTFSSPLESIYGTEISLPPVPKKRRTTEQKEGGEIPDIVQGEIARLRSQFKVNLDPAQPVPKSGMIHLLCQLEDPNLPSVPPLTVTLPPGYPFDASPSCETEMTDYFSTPFLSRVQEALDARLSKMPARFTLSQLLSAWEMSVRAACSPRAQAADAAQKNNGVSQMSVLMGM